MLPQAFETAAQPIIESEMYTPEVGRCWQCTVGNVLLYISAPMTFGPDSQDRQPDAILHPLGCQDLKLLGRSRVLAARALLRRMVCTCRSCGLADLATIACIEELPVVPKKPG